MNSRLRYGLIGAAGVAVLAFAMPFLLPASIYKAEIERSVTQASGRKFTISGPVHFTLIPVLGFRADAVALANTSDRHAATMARADDVRIGVHLWPLLQGRFEVSEIVLDRPQINLEVDPAGHPNWALKRSVSARAGRPHYFSVDTHFSELRIAEGRIAYSNRRTGKSYVIDGLDAAVTFSDPDRPAFAKGAFGYSGQRVKFEARVAVPRQIPEGRTSNLNLSLVSEILQTTYAGSLSPDGDVDGALEIDTKALRRAASWLNIRLPESDGLNALSLRGRVTSHAHVAALRDLNMTLDKMHISGNVTIDDGGDRTALRGKLAIDHLDLNPHIRRAAKPGAPRPHHPDEEWSNDPINLDALKKADADLTLNARVLDVRKLTLGPTTIFAVLQAGRLAARMDPMVLYGGKGEAKLDIDARGPIPTFKSTLRFDNIALQPFLAASIGVKQIEGTGTIALDVVSTGGSANAIMHDINGRGSIAFRNGRLRGVDLGAVARTIASLLGNATNLDAVTRYQTMNGSFDISRGVLVSRDFQLDGPQLNMTGSGSVDAGNRAIDFRIVPQVKASIAEQKLTIGVPFHVKGPWRHVHYTADISGVVNSALENLKAGRAPFKGLFGSAPQKALDKKKKHKNLSDALKNMLGIH